MACSISSKLCVSDIKVDVLLKTRCPVQGYVARLANVGRCGSLKMMSTGKKMTTRLISKEVTHVGGGDGRSRLETDGLGRMTWNSCAQLVV